METFLTKWKALYDTGCLENATSGASASFASGRTAMMLASTSQLTTILEMVAGRFAVGVAYLPRVNDQATGGVNIGGGALYALENGSGHSDAAWKFMGIAYLLVRKKFAGKRLMEVATMIPFAVPGIALGIGYVLSFNQKPLLLTGTASIIIITLVFRTLSVGVEAGSNSLRQVDKSIEEASTILGANNFTTFTRISLPIMKW